MKKGDLLAMIDPRPYAGARRPSAGPARARSSPAENARIDLVRYRDAFKDTRHTRAAAGDPAALGEAGRGNGQARPGQPRRGPGQPGLHATSRSPIDGRVGLRLVDPGNIVPANGTTGLVDHHPAAADHGHLHDCRRRSRRSHRAMQAGRKLTRDRPRPLATAHARRGRPARRSTTRSMPPTGTVRCTRDASPTRTTSCSPTNSSTCASSQDPDPGPVSFRTAAIQRNNDLAVRLCRPARRTVTVPATSRYWRATASQSAVTGADPDDES